MTTWFVSRHPGALDWFADQGLPVERVVAHLDVNLIQAGDKVIGSLPVNLAAEVCVRGAQYWHLSMHLPAELRGQELSVAQMQACGAKLVACSVQMQDDGL